jgi:hypothetical protein
MPSRTKYERDLLKRLKDSEAWPGFPNPEFAQRLERVAVRSLARRSTDADVTAIIILHQLTEQMLRVLIADSQFFVAVSVMPARIVFRDPPRQTFGQVLNILRSGVEFRYKKRLLELAEALNDIRNGIAHKLLQRGSLRGLRADARRSHRLFNRIFSKFDDAHDEFRLTFHGMAKDLL